MLRYNIFFIAILVFAFFVQNFVILEVRSKIPAAYWLPEMITVKEALAASEPSPKIIFLGGSTSLFGVDAHALTQDLNRPVFNMGLVGMLRLDRMLSIGAAVSRKDDILILALEPSFYDCASQSWTKWQLVNALAWDRERYFDRKPLQTQMAAILEAGNPSIAANVMTAWVQERLGSKTIRRRLGALSPRLAAEHLRAVQDGIVPGGFAYAAENLDRFGDIQNTNAHKQVVAGFLPSQPGSICPAVAADLRRFEGAMSQRHVSLAVIHTPYLIEDKTDQSWVAADKQFRRDLEKLGLPLIDNRQDDFFPQRLFYDLGNHLNAEGRAVHTKRLAAALRDFLNSARLSPLGRS